MNKFLRTASTRRLLGVIGGLLIAIVAGTAIAIAAQGSGPVPPPEPLANAIHGALSAPKVQGISADVSFTNKLINTSEIQGVDPLLSGGRGHVWISKDGQFRLELYGSNGDPAVVVTKSIWWIADPTTRTVYEGTLPAGAAAKKKAPSQADSLPTIAQIQADITKAMSHVNLSGAVPTDTGGQPTYTVTVSPKHSAGLLGEAQLAWDAIQGVPLRFAVYARGDNTNPVLELAATNVSYGAVDPSVFAITLPKDYTVTKVSTPAGRRAPETKGKTKHKQISGVRAVASQLPFKLAAPKSVVGLTRQSVSLLDMGGHRGALVTYGQNLGGVAVIEQMATASTAQKLNLSTGSGDHARGLSLPTVSINNATGQELDTALGTLLRFTENGVAYTVIGSVPPTAAVALARGL